jgi:hypothetical protein
VVFGEDEESAKGGDGSSGVKLRLRPS